MTELPEGVPPGALKIEANIPYEECIQLCEQLGLIETVQHAGEDYARLTQSGRNVMFALVRFQAGALDPENILRPT